MRYLTLVLFLCLAAASARAENPGYAKKSAAATAAAAAAAAAAHAAPVDAGNEDDSTPAPAANPAPSKAKAAAKKPAEEEPSVKPAKLSAKDASDVARIQDYLNGLKNISADFLQVDDRGDFKRGMIDIQRPGKMRVVYAPPSKDFIIADGDFVHIWDGTLKAQTNVPEGSSLANFILREPIVLSGGVTIVKFQRFPAKLELTLVQSDDPGAGQLTLIFEDHPLLLRQWRVLDAQGRTTGVNLENERMDVSFDRDTFSFVPPNFGKGGKVQEERSGISIQHLGSSGAQ